MALSHSVEMLWRLMHGMCDAKPTVIFPAKEHDRCFLTATHCHQFHPTGKADLAWMAGYIPKWRTSLSSNWTGRNV